MKAIKQLLPLGESTLLEHVIEQAKATAAREIIVVLGANYETIRAEISSKKINIVFNEHWENGLGSSIAAGIKEVKNKEITAALVMLGDQPLIDSEYLEELIDTHREYPSQIIATKYPTSHGVPVIFPKEWFQELAGLNDDKGAKSIIQQEQYLKVLDPGNKILDLDTPGDYEHFLKIPSAKKGRGL